MINWTSSHEDMQIETRIAERMVNMAHQQGIELKKVDCIMDIDACHCNGNPLKLQELLTADDFNFVHDAFGIRQNINRKTGKLENCFVPRYSK